MRHRRNSAYAAIFLILFACSGCAMMRRKQNVADAIAGIEALEPGLNKSGLAIAEGAKMHMRATVGDADLPLPKMEPDHIQKSPQEYHEKAVQALEDSQVGFWSIVGGGIAAALGLLRFLPGTAGTLASMAYGLFGSRNERQRLRIEKGSAAAVETLAKIMAEVPDDSRAGEVKRKAAESIPEEIKEAFAEWAAING